MKLAIKDTCIDFIAKNYQNLPVAAQKASCNALSAMTEYHIISQYDRKMQKKWSFSGKFPTTLTLAELYREMLTIPYSSRWLPFKSVRKWTSGQLANILKNKLISALIPLIIFIEKSFSKTLIFSDRHILHVFVFLLDYFWSQISRICFDVRHFV